ncbi:MULTISPECIES: NADH dehydrogenase ubiquinone Fe-S protein 4 [Sphingobium]|uniref:NADH dehydrogenase ubiquinone Fe-S protein 4 n=1 Tax=Sphingobium TaxID=165695 RepID=UPI00159C8A62|nr:NADH dehydrogenase ubiquinone Fe-S protein 4 [Sphingobium sp. 15-1]
MAAPAEGRARTFESGPSANDNHAVAVARATSFPHGANAIIEPLALTTNGGRRRQNRWRVRFAPRWGPVADPLIGWTGGGDPLATIELRFPDRASAERYCQRQGLIFECRTARSPGQIRPALPDALGPELSCWPTGPHALCCGNFPCASAAANEDDDRRSA